ncbi:NAD(P)-dependent dehydrogenase (short-subunit alcohol dehydrogenase family) [Actinomycetospora succinea]|uniref:NAD(P)-dependent dehydrogenase (Short-subunit alcohol dehydrogenase family) n=1 Tax=Actinomycetospora succinea TaxID=663603 RepID=A0A4R6UYE5_9PSEU|nr:oxidoreductase [Actinomycetospora succinea]TDQ50973.1 NAD(P)-dependent dehydrogenase (short-subunit alcohol dehydrogenase family) [Actinomycetospora succinea]
MTAWTPADIGDQSGRTFVVTGANSGIGLEASRDLVRAGARVVLAVRDTEKGARAAAEIGDGARGTTDVRKLDLADLASVRAFVADLDGPVDVLVNNAGLMAIPERRTVDGFEMQVGTNFLGHFALTGLLLDVLTDRVVTLSSAAHRIGSIDLSDLNWRRRRYQRWLAYGQSKLADLMFAYELEHRFVAAGSPLRSMAAHPGYSATNLQSRTESVQDAVMGVFNKVVAQGPAMGAQPTLYAATVPDLPGGTYVGPSGFQEISGPPVPVGSTVASHDRETQAALWDLAVELTGVTPRIRSGARS